MLHIRKEQIGKFGPQAAKTFEPAPTPAFRMLHIRKEQMEAFKSDILRKFEDGMAVHLRSQFPEQTKQMKEPELRELVHKGILRAREYEVMFEPDVCRFLECIMVYGIDFDTAPKTAWAGKILRDKKMTGREKMDRIDNYEISVLIGI